MPRVSYYMGSGEPSRIAQPTVDSIKQALLKRMGLRRSELTWQASEKLDLFCRAKAKVVVCDNFFAKTPLIHDDGKAPPAARFYINALKASIVALDALVGALQAMPADDGRIDHALSALTEEGRRAREARKAAW
jgi:hypothetical protein